LKEGKGIHCCNCGRPLDLGPERIPADSKDEKRKDLAIRCVYCLSLFCVPCSVKHFESRNGGRVQKRVTKTTVIEEWKEVPASAWEKEHGTKSGGEPTGQSSRG
jgi:DNA-directed RNA polymerase subunit RPC12/RpoP